MISTLLSLYNYTYKELLIKERNITMYELDISDYMQCDIESGNSAKSPKKDEFGFDTVLSFIWSILQAPIMNFAIDEPELLVSRSMRKYGTKNISNFQTHIAQYTQQQSSQLYCCEHGGIIFHIVYCYDDKQFCTEQCRTSYIEKNK
jgi:hypothetical protein